MHVLAIYSVNEHLADLMSEAAAQRQANAAKPPKAKGSRFGFLTSHFVGRLTTAVAGPTKAFDY